jgi:GT2 family glycosyltransferase
MDNPEPRGKASILTIASGREAHLRNVISGLCRQTVPPGEMVIGVMQDALYADLPETSFPVRQVRVTGPELPLAQGRNAAAAAATGDTLIFVDVDCIPGPTLVEDYLREVGPGQGLMMGEVMYLPAGAADPGWSYAGFDAVAVRHSDRQGPPPGPRRRCEDYRCFWSLNFAIHRQDWDRAGGFDERFVGYGGEDTDFGKTLDALGIPIWWMRGARVYHQHHAHCMPPIHHVASVVRNAEIFAEKWGYRTMEHWLHGFRMMGLVAFEGGEIRILREPGPEDFALCRQQADMPYAATARVIRVLKDRERRQAGLPEDGASLRERHAQMTREQAELVARPERAAG